MGKREGEGRECFTYRAVSILEIRETTSCLVPILLWHNLLQFLLDYAPEFIMVIVQQPDNARGLRVEGAGHLSNCKKQDLSDLLVGNGTLLLELVDCAAVLDSIFEGHRVVRHVGGGGVEFLRVLLREV